MTFYTLDVETANPDYSSICQIGIALFDGDKIIDTWKSYVDPEDYFSGINVSIHGINEKTVRGAPKFPELYSFLKQKLENNLVVHHMPFDRVAFNRVCEKYTKEAFQVIWLDSAKVARRTWEEFSYTGYGLANISEYLGISFIHHDALEDSIAAGKIVNHACKKIGITIDDWIVKVKSPIKKGLSSYTSLKLEGNPSGPLYGETIVFTGALHIPRAEAAKLASEIGCNVGDAVNKSTTILVVGQQDARKLKGEAKSSKHKKVEELIEKGVFINIITEEDFEHITKLR